MPWQQSGHGILQNFVALTILEFSLEQNEIYIKFCDRKKWQLIWLTNSILLIIQCLFGLIQTAS